MFRAVLDTCVLVPALKRDFLLQLAAELAYAPLWGTGILYELDYVLARLNHPAERRKWILQNMREAFPGAAITAPKTGVYHYDVKDPDDAHVAHAAIMGKADAIVTDDRRSGMESSEVLKAAAVEVLNTADFAANTVDAHPEASHAAIEAIAARRKRPPTTAMDLLVHLRDRYAMAEVYEMLEPYIRK